MVPIVAPIMIYESTDETLSVCGYQAYKGSHLCGSKNRWRPLILLTLLTYTEGSVYVGTNRRGSEDKRLITQSYEVPEFLGFNGYLEVTQDGCIPLSEAIYKDVAGGKCFLIIQLQ